LIKTQKEQLYNKYFILGFFSLIYLFFFFYYTLKYNLSFFKYIIVICPILVIAIYYLIQSFLKEEKVLDLQNEDIQERINLITDDIRKSKSRVASLEHKIQRYSSLKGLTEKISSSLSLDEIVNLLVNETFNLLFKKGNVCILYLLEPETKQLGIIATRQDGIKEVIKSKGGDIFDNWVLVKMQPLLIEDTKKDFRFDLTQISLRDTRTFRSLIASPLIIGKRILGLLRIDNPKEEIFNSEDLRFLSTISDLGAMAIENAMLYQRTRELAIRDGLTGLYLRRYFSMQMNQEILRSIRNNSELSLLMLDIDRFKSYNDKFGHIAGDIVLEDISKILKGYFNAPGDIICRYGGEEFAVLLPETSKNKAIMLAQDLRKKIKSTDITLRKKKTYVTVSIGLATFPKDARIKEEFIQKADVRLMKAKQAGRDRVCHS
jgi:diguanylate cyclase (GGDEF)-like protein